MSGRFRQSSLYDVLEVGVTASTEEIEASYQRISSYLGPDALAVYSLMDEDEVLRRRQELDEAYRTLSDVEARSAYDRALGDGGYPQVLVPAGSSDTTASIGVVCAGDDSPVPDVDAIFGAGSDAAPEALPPSDAARDLMPLAPEDDAQNEASERDREPAERPVVRRSPELRPRAPRFSISLGRGYEPLPTSARGAQPAARRLYPDPSIEITPDTEFSGALLRRLRESCRGTLEDVATITKIRRAYIAAIEEHAFDELPAPVYVRGFVSEYARVLGLDAQVVAQSYMTLFRRYKGEAV